MRSRKPVNTAASIAVAALTFFAVAACASPGNSAGSGSATSTSTTSTSDASTSDASTGNDGSLSGHGAIAGATEVPEPPLGIASVSASGQLALLDLVTGEDTAVDELGAVSAVDSNGRYLFATPASGDGVIIADSGAWTVPHGDHFHYYSAEPRVVGTVKGDGLAVVSSATSRTAIWFGDSGTGIVLDGDDLGAGTITEVGRVSTTPHDGVLVPFGDVLLGSVADGEGDVSAVQVYNADGSEKSGVNAACAELSGTITTNVGVVFGCADGALLATTAEANGGSEGSSSESATGESATGASIVFERIPYPEATADTDRAVSFDNRAGRPAVAAVAGTGGAWLLDTRARAWTHIATPTPLLLASAVSDTVGHIVAVDTDGRVVVLDPATGTVVAQTEPLVQASISHESFSAGLSLEVDASRAYVNSAAEGVVYEIDYADNARVARTLETGSTPVHFAEIGR